MNRYWICIVVGWWLVMAGAQAASLQARLVRASNDPKAADAELKLLQPKLQKVFGYHSYQQLTTRKAALEDSKPFSLDLDRGFVLFVKPKEVQDKRRDLDIELTSGRASFVKSSLTIIENGSVFIKGPAVGNDLIIVVLTVNE